MAQPTEQAPPGRPLSELTRYAQSVKEKDYVESTRSASTIYEKNLDRTLALLKADLEQEKAKSIQLQKTIDSPIWDQETDNVATRITQLKVLAAGHRQLAEHPAKLPGHDSHIPALIAARELNDLNPGTKLSIESTSKSLREARRDLQDELSNLSDAEQLHQIFQTRVLDLEMAAFRTQKDDSHTIAVRLMDAEKMLTRKYRQDRESLTQALDTFITDRLAPLLAAEELGGPVTGSVLNITDSMLAAGFTQKGKVNRGRKADDDHRQRRIDEMFGNLAVEVEEDDIAAEAAIAATAMDDLLQRLVQLAFERGGARYLELGKEDAASRFLVRSKLAVLDPRDGKKIRLVDFGKGLDDWL